MSEENRVSDHILPFSESQQGAIVGHCLTNYKFFLKAHTKLRGTWFTKNPLHGVIFDLLCKVYKTDGVFIKSIEEFKSDFFFLDQTPFEKKKYYDAIDLCIFQAKDLFTLDKLERSLTAFLRLSLFKESIEGAAKRYKQQGFEDAYEWSKMRINAIQDASFVDEDVALTFDNPLEWGRKNKDKRSNAISTGCKALDKALGGGLFKSETCAVMAPSNQGKTSVMITIARHAAWQKQDVLFLLHEGNQDEIRERIFMSYLGIEKDTWYKWMDDPSKYEIITAVGEHINKHITYVPYMKTGGMFVEDVVELVKKLNDDRKNKTGKGFDIIIDDYPKKLKSRFAMGKDAARHELALVYDTFNQLAAELDVHVFVAIQTNRNGLRQNSGSIESKTLLGMEEVDESFGIIQNLANVFTLNRSSDDKRKKIVRFNIAKSRGGDTDITINTRTAYHAANVFGDKGMYDNDGMWQIDIPGGFLESYIQESNEKFSTEIIDVALNKQKQLPTTDNSVSLIPTANYVPGKKQET